MVINAYFNFTDSGGTRSDQFHHHIHPALTEKCCIQGFLVQMIFFQVTEKYFIILITSTDFLVSILQFLIGNNHGSGFRGVQDPAFNIKLIESLHFCLL